MQLSRTLYGFLLGSPSSRRCHQPISHSTRRTRHPNKRRRNTHGSKHTVPRTGILGSGLGEVRAAWITSISAGFYVSFSGKRQMRMLGCCFRVQGLMTSISNTQANQCHHKNFMKTSAADVPRKDYTENAENIQRHGAWARKRTMRSVGLTSHLSPRCCAKKVSAGPSTRLASRSIPSS